MKKKIWLAIVLVFSALFFVTGCSGIFLSEETKEKKDISLGSWEGNNYKNDFLGLTYAMPSDWTRYSDEEIKDLMEIGTELVDASEISKKIAELTSVTYMMTTSSTGSNVILMSEKQIGDVKVETFAEALKQGLEAQTAFNYQVADIKTETIDGKEFITVEADVETLKQKYFIYKVDKYMVSIIATAVQGDDINSLISQFNFN